MWYALYNMLLFLVLSRSFSVSWRPNGAAVGGCRSGWDWKEPALPHIPSGPAAGSFGFMPCLLEKSSPSCRWSATCGGAIPIPG